MTDLRPISLETAFAPARSSPEASKLLAYFERAFVINLPERADRRREMEQELRRAGLYDLDKVELFPAVKPREAAGFPSAGARGCFLSHLGVLRRAQQAGLTRVLVMEDDLSISPRLCACEKQLVERLQLDDWAIAYLGHSDPVVPEPCSPLGPFAGALHTSHFYGVRGPFIGQLVAFLEAILSRQPGDPLGGPMHLDGALYTFRTRHPEALTLLAQPNLGTQRSSRSDLHPSWFDRMPVTRSLAQAYRWAKQRAQRASKQ